MHSKHAFFRRHTALAISLAALMGASAASAQVAPGTTGIDASGSYQQEINACMTGKTQQDKDTCLLEAKNAQAEKQRGTLTNNAASGSQLDANAAARCNAFTGEEKAACELRVKGYGATSGSVAGGGVLRQVETVVMPNSSSSITINPQTPNPVVLVPIK